MIKKLIYIGLALSLIFTGCRQRRTAADDILKWTITLDREDKKPYGAYLAYQSLQYYFPEAKIDALSKSFRYTSISDDMKYNYSGHSLLILEGLSFRLSASEWFGLKQFVKNGNEVIIFMSLLDEKVENDLKCYKETGGEERYLYYSDTSEFYNRKLLCIADDSLKKYGYYGRSLKGFFIFPTTKLGPDDTSSGSTESTGDSSKDSAVDPSKSTDHNTSDATTTAEEDGDINLVPDTLGYVYRNVNFLRYKIGEGHLTLHGAPLVLSNYFLLQPGNERYLTAIWQTLPKNINHIYWHNYYKRSSDVSSFQILWRYPATRYGLLLALLLLTFYVIFEAKRKQRVIPILPPLKNDSVSFVETVGRLYYNKGNHSNLAEKMCQQFLEWVRTHYYLNTNALGDDFIQQLTIKSGQPPALVRSAVEMVVEIKHHGIAIDDAYLYQFYNTIQQFYKSKN